jgi:anti-anti-sigma factor
VIAHVERVRVSLFNCQVQEEAGAVVLCVSGEIDLAAAPLLDAELGRCLERSQPVIVDFSEVIYCDMSGVRALERCHQALRERGHRLIVVAPPGIIRRLFALVELDKRITMADTPDGALALLPRAETRLMDSGEG